MGDAATEAAVKAQPFADYRVLHLAAHGIMSTKVPARSALVLRPSGAEDGLLQAREILNLRLNALAWSRYRRAIRAPAPHRDRMASRASFVPSLRPARERLSPTSGPRMTPSAPR